MTIENISKYIVNATARPLPQYKLNTEIILECAKNNVIKVHNTGTDFIIKYGLVFSIIINILNFWLIYKCRNKIDRILIFILSVGNYIISVYWVLLHFFRYENITLLAILHNIYFFCLVYFLLTTYKNWNGDKFDYIDKLMEWHKKRTKTD